MCIRDRTWNENLCERSKKIEVEDRIQKTVGKDEETVFGLPGAVRSLRIFEEVGGGFGKKNLQGWERRSRGKFTILLVFLRKRRRWVFSLHKYASGLGSTNLCEGFFGLIFPTKRIFESTVLLLKKNSEMSTLSGSSPVFVSDNHLRLKRSSLLNVYLNYKFEISLLTSHLFFSLFN